MTHQVNPGTGVPPAGATRRPLLLAGGLLSGSGLIDMVAGFAVLTADPYVVISRGAVYLLDITGWSWLHVAVGAVGAVAGLLVPAGRRWTSRFGVAAALLSIALHLMVFPYHPVRAVVVTLFDACAIRLLVRYRHAARGRPPG